MVQSAFAIHGAGRGRPHTGVLVRQGVALRAGLARLVDERLGHGVLPPAALLKRRARLRRGVGVAVQEAEDGGRGVSLPPGHLSPPPVGGPEP